jgi:putative copper resistance protein D
LNFIIVRRVRRSDTRVLPYLKRFAEAEIAIGFTVVLAAASLTSQPPAIDMASGRVTSTEIVQRFRLRLPRFSTPALSELSPATPLGFSAPAVSTSQLQSFVPGYSPYTNGPGDIAWSEYNHHWSGLVVFVIGVLALTARTTGWRAAQHWPLAFLALALFLFLRSDPENWPLGPRGFWESFAVAEVLQHRVFVLLIVAFAIFEWRIQTGRTTSRRAALVFPAVCIGGGALLLTHSHSLGNVSEELLAELSHIPLAILAVVAGSTRRLELQLSGSNSRIPGGIWPICFVLIGVILMNYHES